MIKVKEFLGRHQIIRYLCFGITTTVVAWVVYFGILVAGRALAGIAVDDTVSPQYFLLYTIAQTTQWIASVLVAFFTNKKWVFTDASNDDSTAKQLSIFAGGRFATFLMDYAVTYFGAVALTLLLPALSNVSVGGNSININEISAKLIAAVMVIIGNYIFSKLFVFKNS